MTPNPNQNNEKLTKAKMIMDMAENYDKAMSPNRVNNYISELSDISIPLLRKLISRWYDNPATTNNLFPRPCQLRELVKPGENGGTQLDLVVEPEEETPHADPQRVAEIIAQFKRKVSLP